jgi:hypothetical protein
LQSARTSADDEINRLHRTTYSTSGTPALAQVARFKIFYMLKTGLFEHAVISPLFGHNIRRPP